jgi:hypothetical protein
MKRFHFLRIIIIALITSGLSLATTIEAQERTPSEAKESASVQTQGPVSLTVEFATICRDVVNREAVDSGTRFQASVGKLYCFTKIIGAQTYSEIIHVWYYGETEKARVTLEVNSPRWRTYSSKIIQPQEIGEWHVDVLGPEGNRLMSIPFAISQ